jgi:hypothetical protein
MQKMVLRSLTVQSKGWLVRMFRVITKHGMFDLQAVLLMCWINRVEHETFLLTQSFVVAFQAC